MNKFKIFKSIIIIATLVTIFLILIFTIDVINDEPNWAWFDVDFDNNKVSNYGTLISGLLSFSAILFGKIFFNL